MHKYERAKELEDRSIIAHACDECVRRFIFSDIIYSGHYLESLALFLCKKLSLSLETRIVRVVCLPLIGEDCSIGGAIRVRV